MARLKNIYKHKGFLHVVQKVCKDKGGSVAPVPTQGGELDVLQWLRWLMVF